MSYYAKVAQSLMRNLQQLDSELSTGEGRGLPHLLDGHPYLGLDDPEQLPTQAAFKLVEKIRVDIKAIEALVTPTHFKLIELGTLQYKVAALNAAVTLDVASVIELLGGEVSLRDLAVKLTVNENKLGRIMRVLTAEYIFQETSLNMFKNTRHSIALSGDKPGARSFLSFITDLGMQAATGITKDISSSDTRDSFAETTAPFRKVASKDGQTFFQYLTASDNSEMVTLATEGVVGWLNRLTRAALLYDYPWSELGEATVIDVGCGPGDSGIDIMRKYPGLKWVFQDFAHVIEGVKKDFPQDMRVKVDSGAVSFVVQDYFQPNTSRGNVWYLRGVLHEYDDTEFLAILKHLTVAMRETSGSRMIINEILNSSPTIISTSSASVPSENIPERQSALADIANAMTWSTFALFGGKERSFQEYAQLLNKAGLEISRMSRFRTFTIMLECQLAT